MDRYRERYGPPSDCESHKYLQQILELRQPEVDVNTTSIQELQDLERTSFYPKQVTNIFNRSKVEQILSCECSRCKATRRTTPTERQVRTDAVFKEYKLHLAVLIYLAHADLIHDFIRANITDKSTSPSVRTILKDKYGGLKGKLGSQQTVEHFCNKFDEAFALFKPVQLSLNQPCCFHDKDRRFPYLDDQYHASGSFGEVRKFDIHPDYLDDEIRLCSWYKESRDVKFARKILKSEPKSRSGRNRAEWAEWQIERDLLNLFGKERHRNIIQVINVYQWNDRINFVFPFYPNNLHDILHSTASSGPTDVHDKDVKHWLWTQMRGVADGLSTIHSPRKMSAASRGTVSYIGFHYDLKPANILVTPKPNRVLKITDFGQSWIKAKSTNDDSDGNYRGGSLIYRPPEACPTRKEVSRGIPNDPKLRRDGSAHIKPTLTKFRNVYDVWSLGCIMIEVLTFIFNGGSSAVKQFQQDREIENTGIAFHNGQGGPEAKLNLSVEKAISHFSSIETPSFATSCYLRGLSDLLRHMLDTDQGLRCTSEEVVVQLDRLQHDFEDNDNSEDELAMRIKYRLLDGYDEVETSSGGSFVHMSGISFRKEAQEDSNDCRLKLWRHRHTGKLVISRCLRDNRTNLVETVEQYVTEGRFWPCYLFDGQRSNDCRVSEANEQSSLWYSFESISDRIEFQQAITSQDVLQELGQALECYVRFQRKCFLGPDIVQHEARRIEIWRYRHRDHQPHHQLSATTGGSSIASGRTPHVQGLQPDFKVYQRHRMMLFTDSGYLSIPVHGGNIEIRDGKKGETKVEWESSLSLCIKPASRYIKTSKLMGGEHQSGEAIPVDLNRCNKDETEKALCIEITFPDWDAKRNWLQSLVKYEPLSSAWRPAKGEVQSKRV